MSATTTILKWWPRRKRIPRGWRVIRQWRTLHSRYAILIEKVVA